MKGFVAICFFFLALAFVAGKPGGYTANNDLVKVKFDNEKWGDAKRAGDFARSLLLKEDEDLERKQSARESKSSQIEDAEPALSNGPAAPIEAPVAPVEAPVAPVKAPVAPVAAAAAVLPQVAAAVRQPYFNQFLTNPYTGFPLQQQQFFYRFG